MTEAIGDPTRGQDRQRRTTRQPDRKRDPLDDLAGVLTSMSRYDFALWLIPFAFASALLTANVVGMSIAQALVPAVLVGICVLVDALYLNPPIDPGERSA